MTSTTAKPRKLNHHVTSKFNVAQLNEQPLFATNPQAALPLLSMIGQAQLSIDDLLGQLSRQFIEQLLVLSAQSVAGSQHKGRHTGEVRWHGSQSGVVNLGQSKMRLKRPRLRTSGGEVAVPAYAALANDGELSRRIADILVCNVSTRKYARVVHRCANELGISKSAVSRQFVKQSAQAWAQLMSRDLSQQDFVAMYVDGVIVAKHHIIAAVGVDAQGNKHVLGLAPGSSENAKVVKDLLSDLARRGVDLNVPRLWVIDGSKALRSGIEQLCGKDAKVQRWRIHKIRNVSERLPKDRAEQVRWLMKQAFKLDAPKGRQRLKELAKDLKAQHPDAAASVLEGMDEMFTITELGITGELARCLATTNVIESPNSVVRRVSGRVTNYKDAQMALRWTDAGFIEAEKRFKKLRDYADLKILINSLRPAAQPLKKAA
ncbi:MAG: IS256 family transposase [Betaproteobacteria bacterium]|nr:IS256 family transposase [Betaproteobacteria bacterium]